MTDREASDGLVDARTFREVMRACPLPSNKHTQRCWSKCKSAQGTSFPSPAPGGCPVPAQREDPPLALRAQLDPEALVDVLAGLLADAMARAHTQRLQQQGQPRPAAAAAALSEEEVREVALGPLPLDLAVQVSMGGAATTSPCAWLARAGRAGGQGVALRHTWRTWHHAYMVGLQSWGHRR